MNSITKKVDPVGGSYVSPAVDVIDIMAEGVLCQSGQFEGWQEEEL